MQPDDWTYDHVSVTCHAYRVMPVAVVLTSAVQ